MATLCSNMNDNDVPAANLLSSKCSSTIPPIEDVNSYTPSVSAVKDQVNPPGFVKNIPNVRSSPMSNQLSHSVHNTLAIKGHDVSQQDWLETNPSDSFSANSSCDPVSTTSRPVPKTDSSLMGLPLAKVTDVCSSFSEGEVSHSFVGTHTRIDRAINFIHTVNNDNNNKLPNNIDIESNYLNATVNGLKVKKHGNISLVK